MDYEAEVKKVYPDAHVWYTQDYDFGVFTKDKYLACSIYSKEDAWKNAYDRIKKEGL